MEKRRRERRSFAARHLIRSRPRRARGLRAEPGRASDERRLLGGEAEDHLGIRRAPERERRVRRGKAKSGNKEPCEEEEKLVRGQGGRRVTARTLCAAHSGLGGGRSPARQPRHQRAGGRRREACLVLAVPPSLCPQGLGLVFSGEGPEACSGRQDKASSWGSRGKNLLKPDGGCCAQPLFSMNQSPARAPAHPSTVLLFGSPFVVLPRPLTTLPTKEMSSKPEPCSTALS